MTEQVSITRRSMGGLVFDAVFEETHESELDVTDNPVETGVIVSDHAHMLPLRLSISAGVSDTPLREMSNDRFAGISSSEANQIKAELGPDSFIYDSRSRRAFQLLRELQETAEPFNVFTGLRLYRNMVCTSIRTSQDKDSSGVLLFTADLREVRIVNTEMVKYDINPEPGPTARQAGPKKNKGEQQSKEVTNPATRKSLLRKLSDATMGKR